MWRTIHIPERDFKRSNFTASKPDGKYTINVYDSNLETIKVFRCDGYTLQVAGPGYQELAYNKDMPGRTKYTIERKSPFTGMVNQMEIELDPNDYVNWKNGVNIQDAFPYLTADEREFIKTGITPEDWATLQELRYNNSMTIKQLKAVITWMEKEKLIGPSTPVIIGKHGTSGVLDGPEVQKEVTSTDIQAIPGGESIAFTLVHK